MIRTLTENLWWKLLSIVVAFVLWARFSAQTELGTSIPVAVQYRNLPPNLEITDPVAIDRVYMNLVGPTGSLTPSSLSSTAVLVDLKGINRPGERTFSLSESNVQLPTGVHLLKVIPSQLHLRFETRVSKDVPVEPYFLSSVPAGYRVVSQQVVPDRVRITGPQSRVAAIASLRSDPIDLSGTYGDAEFRISPGVSDPTVHLEPPSTVVVRVKLEKSIK